MYGFRCHGISTDMFIGIVKQRMKGFYTSKYVCLNLESGLTVYVCTIGCGVMWGLGACKENKSRL